jgi:hypothetical protein
MEGTINISRLEILKVEVMEKKPLTGGQFKFKTLC